MLDTNDIVAITDGTAGLVGEVPEGYFSIETPVLETHHIN
jgi:hypothetical protein